MVGVVYRERECQTPNFLSTARLQCIAGVSVLGREEGYTVKYVPESKEFPEGAAQGKS